MNINEELNALSKLLEKQHRTLTRIDNELQGIDDQLDAKLLRLQEEDGAYR